MEVVFACNGRQGKDFVCTASRGGDMSRYRFMVE